MTIGSKLPSAFAGSGEGSIFSRGEKPVQTTRADQSVRWRTSEGPIRVVHLVWTLDIGGLEKMVLELTTRADRDLVQPHVVCLGEPGALAPRFQAAGVPVECLNVQSTGKLGSVVRLVQKLRELRPHVLHTHNPTPHLRGAIAAVLARIPVLVHTKHGRNYTDQPRTLLANRLASCLTDRVVPVSDDAADVAARLERVSPEKIHVIRNGVDVAAFSSGRGQGQGQATQGAFTAIQVGRLNFIKDQRSLLRAARIVVDAEPRFRLDLIGDGPDRAHLQSLCDELRLREHVQFLGFRDNVRELLAAATVFVLPSISEGISLTLLEAMAAGLPVVATKVGGNQEVVVANETGLLVPAESPRELAKGILRIIQDPDLARRLGNAGRKRVESCFDIRVVVGQYESLYVSLLEGKRHSRGRKSNPQA